MSKSETQQEADCMKKQKVKQLMVKKLASLVEKIGK